MSDARLELRKWIGEMRKRTAPGGHIVFRLKHLRGDEERTGAVDWCVVSQERSDEDLEQWASTRSAQDANILRGAQRYGLFVYFGEQYCDPNVAGVAVSRFTWLVQAGDNLDDVNVGSTERANGEGLIAQSMRHAEVFARLLVQNVQQSAGSKDAELQRLTSQVQWYAERDARRQMEHEAALDKQQERQLKAETHKANQQHIQDLVFTARGLLPICVNFLAGREVLPITTTPDRELLRVFMESLTMEQFMGLNAVLKPEQMVAVGQVWQHYAEEEKRRKLAQAPPPPPEPSSGNALAPSNGATNGTRN